MTGTHGKSHTRIIYQEDRQLSLIDDCKNGYTYFSKSISNLISGTHGTFSLYDDGGYVWIIAKPRKSQIYDCDNNWNIYNSNIGVFIANDLIKVGSASQLSIRPTPQQTINIIKI